MMYIVQIAVVVYVLWASIYYQWDAGAPAVTVVAILAAAVVTGVIDEIQQLPSRFIRMKERLFSLQDEPSRDIASLPRSSWHGSDTLEKRDRLRIEKDIG